MLGAPEQTGSWERKDSVLLLRASPTPQLSSSRPSKGKRDSLDKIPKDRALGWGVGKDSYKANTARKQSNADYINVIKIPKRKYKHCILLSSSVNEICMVIIT